MSRSIFPAALIAAALMVHACGTPQKGDPISGDCTGRLPGDLVITEFLTDPSGVDEGKEYIEIFNGSTQVIELAGVTLRHSRADGTAEKKTNLTKGSINPGDYYVVGDVRDENIPAHLNDTYGDGLGALSNTNGKIAVLCGTELIDEITYTVSKENTARILDGAMFPDATANDDEARWCYATEVSGDFVGSPRAKNAPCAKTTCSGRNAGDLVITELLANPAGEDTGNEYIEIYNATAVEIDLAGVTLRYSRLDGSSGKETPLPAGTIGAGKYYTLGSATTTPLPAHIDLSYGTALGALGNTDGRVSLTCDSTLIDEIQYTGATDATARVLDGNIAPPSATANDDQSAWCDAKASFGAGFGSPRSANESCGSTVAGCIDRTTGTLRPPVGPTEGKLFITEVMADPTAPTGTTTADREWFELYATEPMDLNGVQVQRVTPSGTVSKVILSSPAGECISVAAQSHSVVARKLTPDINGGIASPVATFDFALIPTDTLYVSYNGVAIDQATYPNATGTGVSAAFSSDRMEPWVNDSEYAWCDGQGAYGSGGQGTPGAANPVCPAAVAPGECRQGDITDGGFARAILRPDGGSVVITEVMASPYPPSGVPTDSPKEWFELTANTAVDLNESEFSNDLGEKITIKQAACFTVDPGQYVLFAQASDPDQNGGLPAPNVIFPFLLTSNASAANPSPAVTMRSQGAEVEKFSWTTTTVGASMQLSSTAPLMPDANEVSTNRCDTPEATTYGDAGTPDRGTPGAPNVACP